MKNRKRINISVDSCTYDRIQRLADSLGFRSRCVLVVSCVRVMLDSMSRKPQPSTETDSVYIRRMFDDLAAHERIPDGTVPVRHPSRKCI